MGLINLPSVDEIAQEKDPKRQMEMMLNTMGLLMKNLTELNGYINSKNVFEQGGWRVKDSELVSKDGDVGMSTEDTVADDVRFYAGGVTKETSPWRVHKSGKMVATGALIQSSDGTYPKVILDPDNDLLGAYSAVDKYVQIKALDGTTSTPAIIMRDGSIPLTATIYLDNLLNELSIGANGNIQISAMPGGDVRISGNLIRFPNWSSIYSSEAAQTLQTALNNKANGSGLSRTVYVALTSGGPATSPMTISNGIVTS